MTHLAQHCDSLGCLHMSQDRGSPACESWDSPLVSSVDTHGDQFKMTPRNIQELGVSRRAGLLV